MKLHVFLNLLVLLALASACATGKVPPADTTTAKVPAGTFLFGLGSQGCKIPQGNECTDEIKFDPGTPSRLIQLDAFEIDVHEVTVEQYRYCEQAGVCSQPAGDNGPAGQVDYYTNEKFNQFPVVFVNWQQAAEYCAFRGKRLPTEFEWERVASGESSTVDGKRLYPAKLSDMAGPDAKLPTPCSFDVNIQPCNNGSADTKPVATAQDDFVLVGGAKVFDLTGNVSEWTASGADEPANKLSATCDFSQPYACSECLDCLRTGNKTKCAPQCLKCPCGKEEPGKPPKSNCYTPCDAPVCPTFPGSDALARSYTAKPAGSKRVIRGGSFVAAAGFDQDCANRFDFRGFARAPGAAALPHVGFRCAKSD
jgi:formylglycine-generating enzyme required for sulfatase activity